MSRETLLPQLAAHVLAEGLAAASLRPLAKAAGTSDRMLIYHFGNKEQLVEDVLAHIADTYSDALDAMMGEQRAVSRAEVVERILSLVHDPALHPFQALWWEIVAGCARDVPGHLEAARSIMTRLLAWLETQLPEDDPDPAGGARYLLTLIEGAQMLGTVGHRDTARTGLDIGLVASSADAP